MAPIEVKEAAKRATPKLADGLFVLEAFLEAGLPYCDHLEMLGFKCVCYE